MRGVQELDTATIAAFQRGDEGAFARISQRHYRELHIHCYRMIGSFDEAEDLVQETMMRAWQRRDSFEGRASLRAWLYRIATNICIDAIRARSARDVRQEIAWPPRYARFPWLQPYPDELLNASEGDADPPDSAAHEPTVSRDTIELAFLATIQLLPPKQRAVLILRDVLDFSAAETARLLDDTTGAVTSALQRARATLAKRRGGTATKAQAATSAFTEAMLLEAFMDAQDRGDVHALVELLRDDVRMTLMPDGETWDGRDSVSRELFKKRADFDGDVRSVPVAANRQPALAVYVRPRGDTEYQAWGVVMLGVREGKVREIATFASPAHFGRFNLPRTLLERDFATRAGQRPAQVRAP